MPRRPTLTNFRAVCIVGSGDNRFYSSRCNQDSSLGNSARTRRGRYAYAGQLILQGIPPYKLAYNMKFPGTYAAYALIMSIFGQTIHAIHLGLLLIDIATIALVFLVGRRLVNTIAGITAAASYAVLSVSPSVLGLAAHATHFVMLPVLGGILLLFNNNSDGFRAVETKPVLANVRLRIAVWDWHPNETACPPLCSLGSNLHFWNDLNRRFSRKRMLLQILIFGTGVVVPLGLRP